MWAPPAPPRPAATITITITITVKPQARTCTAEDIACNQALIQRVCDASLVSGATMLPCNDHLSTYHARAL